VLDDWVDVPLGRLEQYQRHIDPVPAGGGGGALLVLHAGTAPALGLATGLLVVVTGGAALAARRPGPWRGG